MDETTTDIVRTIHCSPQTLATAGVEQVAPRSNKYVSNFEQEYNYTLTDSTRPIVELIGSSANASSVFEAAIAHDLHEADGYESIRVSERIDDLDRETQQRLKNGAGVDLGVVLRLIDHSPNDGLASRSSDPTEVSRKSDRDEVHFATLAAEPGDVYMAKTLASPTKIKLAWALDPDNTVVHVDTYDFWEDVFGWQKLKDLPTAASTIYDEYGDQLSSEQLAELAPKSERQQSGQSSGTRGSSGSSGGTPSTAQKPITLSAARNNYKKETYTAETIKDTLTSGESLEISYSTDTDYIILFPSDTDLLLSKHWWLCGRVPDGHEANESVTIANCTNAVYEYLSDCQNVRHIDDVYEAALDQQVLTTDGEQLVRNLDNQRTLVHVVPDTLYDRFTDSQYFTDMPRVVQEINGGRELNDSHNTVLPPADEMVWAPVSPTTAYRMAPRFNNPDYYEGERLPVVTHSNTVCEPLHLPTLSLGREAYLRVNLPEWPVDCPEIETLLNTKESRIGLNGDGKHVLDTLVTLHDLGEAPPSTSADQ